MFEQFGDDYFRERLQLNNLLPSVNQSETSFSILSTLFDRWLTKRDVQLISGRIGFSNPPHPRVVDERTAARQAFQLTPVATVVQGTDKIVMDWIDILRKAVYHGVDIHTYYQWGVCNQYSFSPPINFDKLINYNDYFWVDTADLLSLPQYVVIGHPPTGAIVDSRATPWVDRNKWKQKNEVLPEEQSIARKAQMPIIEFDYNIELDVQDVNDALLDTDQDLPHPLFKLFDADGEYWGSSRLWEFDTSSNLTVNQLINQRIISSNSFEDFTFRHHFVGPSGQLLFIKTTDTESQLKTIWGKQTQYIPSYVDATRTRRHIVNTNPITPSPPDISVEGTWEPHPGIATNPLNETRSVVRLSELFLHFDSIVKGGRGTMFLNEPAVQSLISSLVVPNGSVPVLVDFVKQQRLTQLQDIRGKFTQKIVETVVAPGTRVAQTASVVYQQIKNEAKFATVQTTAFNNSLSYNDLTDIGFPNIQPSFAMLGLVGSTPPSVGAVGTQTVVNLHEAGLSIDISLPIVQKTTIIESIARQTNAFRQSLSSPPVPTSNFQFWAPPSHPTTGRKLYRFEVDYFAIFPPVAVAQGSLWLDQSNVLRRFTPSGWVDVPITEGWVEIDLTQILANVIQLFERDLYLRTVEISPTVVDYDEDMPPGSDTIRDRIITRDFETYFAVQNLINPNNVGLISATAEQTQQQFWQTSHFGLASRITAYFRINPIVWFRNVLRPYTKIVNGLPIRRDTNAPFSRNEISIDRLSQHTYHQLVESYSKFNKKSSTTQPMVQSLEQWTTELAYLTSGLIDPQSCQIFDQCEQITNYKIELRKVENVKTLKFSNLLIRLVTPGSNGSLISGNGDDWTFELTCSAPNVLDRYRYGVLKQTTTWDPAVQLLRISPSERNKWKTGDEVRVVQTQTTVDGRQITNETQLFVRVRTTPQTLTIHESEQDAQTAANPIIFTPQTSTVEIQQLETTFTTTSQYGSRRWFAPAPDRSEVIQFDFPVRINGVQQLIDFYQGFVRYMEDDGFRFNIGEQPIIDPETGTVVTWKQQLVKCISAMYDSLGFSTREYLDIGAQDDRQKLRSLYYEMNPFKEAVWIFTPDGVIADMFKQPYQFENRSSISLYDDVGNPITQNVTPLRSDRITSIIYTPPESDPSSTPHLATGQISIDFYEHVILFDQQIANGLVVYDRFFNLQKPYFEVEFERNSIHFFRPSMGGYLTSKSQTLPNFETVAEIQRNDYSISTGIDSAQSTKRTRSSLGYQPQQFFDVIPVSTKTNFQYWKGMIREKGTVSSFKVFGKHPLIEQNDVDQFWAWKAGTFGSIQPRFQYEIALGANDGLARTLNLTFNPAVSFPAQGSQDVNPTDETRWVDYPQYVETLAKSGEQYVYHAARVNQSILFIGSQYQPGDFDHQMIGQDFVVKSMVFNQDDVMIHHYSPSQVIDISDIDSYSLTDKRVAVVHNNTVVSNNQYIIEGTVLQLSFDPSGPVSVYVFDDVDALTVQSVVVTIVAQSRLNLPTLMSAGTNQFRIVEIQAIVPDYLRHTPVRLIDRGTKQIETELPAWDPYTNVHTRTIGDIDIVSEFDGAKYAPNVKLDVDREDRFWSDQQVGTYWWDTSTYRITFNNRGLVTDNQQLINSWGAAYEGTSPTVYQWIKSTTPPERFTRGKPYTRLLKKTRTSALLSVDTQVIINTITQNVVFASSTFVDGDIVRLYPDLVNDSSSSIPQSLVGVDLEVQRISPTQFRLLLPSTSIQIEVDVDDQLFAGSLLIAVADWDEFEWETVVYPLTIVDGAVGTTFPLPLSIVDTVEDVEGTATVWVDGKQVPFAVDALTNTLSVFQPDGTTPLVVSVSNVVAIKYDLPEATIEPGAPLTSDIAVPTVYVIDFPRSTTIEFNGIEPIEQYFYWVAGVEDEKPTEKQHTTPTVELLLARPVDNRFYFAVNYNLDNNCYDTVVLSGLYQYPQLQQYSIAYDIDQNIRHTRRENDKNHHEKWILFRERQQAEFPQQLIDHVRKTIVGIGPDSITVPSSSRVGYDQFFGTTLQYGTDDTQVLIDKFTARSLLIEYFTDPSQTDDALLSTQITQLNPQTPTQWGQAFDQCVNIFDTIVVNRFIMLVIRTGLHRGYQYDKLIKTSYISLETTQQVITQQG